LLPTVACDAASHGRPGHEWGQPEGGSENREALSDHAALVVEVGEGAAGSG
jgi:hypothetical protein